MILRGIFITAFLWNPEVNLPFALVLPSALPYLLFFSKAAAQPQIPPTCRRETRGHHADPFPVKGSIILKHITNT